METSLLSAVQDVLGQGLLFLDCLSDEIYARPLGGVFGGTLGAHYRHVLDHFLCLLEGIRSGEINYDQRRRDPQLEQSVLRARIATEVLMSEFRDLSVDDLRNSCVVTYQVGYGESEQPAVASNVAREAMFCVGHAVHHYAILKLLCAEVQVQLPYEFGVAPSTLKHLATAGRA